MTGSDLKEESPVLPSGKWMGHFVDPRHIDPQHPEGHKWPIDVVMTFKNGGRSFVAFGVDEVGAFEFKNGKIEGEKCSFLKVYPTHDVTYEGLVSGQQLVGQWWLTDYPDIRGDFSIWPDLPA